MNNGNTSILKIIVHQPEISKYKDELSKIRDHGKFRTKGITPYITLYYIGVYKSFNVSEWILSAICLFQTR